MNKVPLHVSMIMDGNGRWAKKRNMPRNYGHVQGSKTVEQIIEDLCQDIFNKATGAQAIKAVNVHKNCSK